MTRYVVVARSHDEYVRVFGAFRNRARAEALAERVNKRIEQREDDEFESWRERDDDAKPEMAPDGYGRVGVLVLHKWSAKRALRFAFGEMDS